MRQGTERQGTEGIGNMYPDKNSWHVISVLGNNCRIAIGGPEYCFQQKVVFCVWAYKCKKKNTSTTGQIQRGGDPILKMLMAMKNYNFPCEPIHWGLNIHLLGMEGAVKSAVGANWGAAGWKGQLWLGMRNSSTLLKWWYSTEVTSEVKWPQ